MVIAVTSECSDVAVLVDKKIGKTPSSLHELTYLSPYLEAHVPAYTMLLVLCSAGSYCTGIAAAKVQLALA